MSETEEQPDFEIQPVQPPRATLKLSSRQDEDEIDVDVELEGFEEPEHMTMAVGTVKDWVEAGKEVVDTVSDVVSGGGAGGGGGGGDVIVICTDCEVTVEK